MTRLEWLGAIALALGLTWAGLTLQRHLSASRAQEQMVQADAQHTQAVQHAAQGAAHDSTAQALEAQIAKDAALVAQLRARLAKLNSAPVPRPPAPSTPDPQPVAPVSPGVLDAGKDALIAAQDALIEDQVQQIHTLTLARDSWKAAYESSEKEAASVRIVAEARLQAIKASRWQGRIEGFVIGVGAGFAGGKL